MSKLKPVIAPFLCTIAVWSLALSEAPRRLGFQPIIRTDLLDKVPLIPFLPASWREAARLDVLSEDMNIFGQSGSLDDAYIQQKNRLTGLSAAVLAGRVGTRAQAFDLGVQAGIFLHAKSSETERQTALNEAARILLPLHMQQQQHAAPVTRLSEAQIAGLRVALEELDNDRGIATRLAGILNFVNIIWFASIVGILAVIGPFISYWMRPLAHIAISFWKKVVVPIGRALHNGGVFEMMSYIVCVWFLCEGLRWPGNAGMFIGLVGVLGLVPSFTYTVALHSKNSGKAEDFAFALNLFLFVNAAPMATLFQSFLFGWISVMSLYAAMGFSTFALGLCWVIGFASKQALQRCTATSLLLVVLFTILRVVHVSSVILFPFTSPTLVMGTNVFFLGMLISSSRYQQEFSQNRSDMRYYWLNGVTIVSLLVALLFGNVFNIQSLANTGATWGVLFVMDKGAELPIWKNTGMILLGLLFLFGSLFAMSLFLNSHPSFVADMLDSSWMIQNAK